MRRLRATHHHENSASLGRHVRALVAAPALVLALALNLYVALARRWVPMLPPLTCRRSQNLELPTPLCAINPCVWSWFM
eukprot:SAG31_NODE_1054_length_10140_cov_4.264316_15_plen_79_part_00